MLSWTRPSSILELSGSILDPLGLDFRDFLGWLVACNRPIYLMHELLHETLRGIHLCFSFPTCSAAVRAQHMELETSWAFWRLKTSGLGHFYLLKLNVLKNSVLEGLGLDFGSLRPSI